MKTEADEFSALRVFLLTLGLIGTFFAAVTFGLAGIVAGGIFLIIVALAK